MDSFGIETPKKIHFQFLISKLGEILPVKKKAGYDQLSVFSVELGEEQQDWENALCFFWGQN